MPYKRWMKRTIHGEEDTRLYLFPDMIYVFHRIVHEILCDHNLTKFGEDKDEKLVTIQPTLFSKHTRTFHWVGVADWQIDPNKIVSAIREAMTRKVPSTATSEERKATIEKEWNDFYNNLTGSRVLGKIKDAVNYVDPYIEDAARQIGPDDQITALRHLLAIYEGYHHDPKLYLDGIVYRNLINLHAMLGNSLANKIDYLYGELVGEKIETRNNNGKLVITKAGHYKRYKWVKASFHLESPLPSSPLFDYQCQEVMGIDGPSLTTLNAGQAEDLDHPGLPVALKLTDSIFFDQIKTTFNKEPTHVLLLPLYDVCIGEETWGSLCGNLVLFFGDGKHLNHFIGKSDSGTGGKTLLDMLRDKSQRIIQECNKSGALLLLSQALIAPYDLIQHFLRNLNIVQDWKRITVYRGKKPQYSYHWWRNPEKVNEPEWKQYEWKRCDCGAGASDTNSCEPCLPWEDTRDNKKFLRWEQNLDIWSGAFLPDISDEEKQAFGDIHLAFEYPITACIPEDEIKRKMLGEEYIRQQLEVLRGLIPKVRARRAALRSAVSAIMGRNMSHNIGSHVLARYSSKIKDDRDKVAPDKTDHRGDFLTYLQRRMDFLAEVATSDQAFWSQPLSLKDQIIRLNYGEQQKRFTELTDQEKQYKSDGEPCLFHLSPKGPKEIKHKPIILSFITGKESLLASVEWGMPKKTCDHPLGQDPTDCGRGYLPNQKQKDVWFACPGGEVGVHALYIILENIIRNSARHGGTSDDTVRVFVHVEKDEPDTDLLKMEIIDPRTQLEADGRLIGTYSTEAAEEEKQELAEKGNGHSLFDADGKRKKLICLDKNINSILHDEPFLDASGNPNPKYWGVREMQICAHYLRRNRLSDLEGMRDNKRVLEAGVRELENGSHCLNYTLYLQRAKLMAVVVRDDSTYKKQAEKLRQKGIFVVGSGNGGVPYWKKIAADVSGYSFLVVEEGIDLPKEMRTSLPVRTFNLPLKKIKMALDDPSQEIAWMEPLHQHWAEKCRNRRYAWMGKPLWGVAVEGGIALTVLNLNSPPTLVPPAEQKNGLFRVPKRSDEKGIAPLPDPVMKWHRSLENEAIAAAWVDHLPKKQVGFGGAGLGQAYKLTRENVRLWISVEGAFSDSPHSAYLNLCPKGSGSEILAAAVPRVAVLDERVQSELNTPSRIGFELSTAWAYMGVWVPAKPKKDGRETIVECRNKLPLCNLDAPVFGEIQAYLKQPAKRQDQFPIDFLVIHLTILERLSNEKNSSLRKTLTELISGTQAERAEIIIVTGRGVPSIALDPDNMDNVRYLPISALLESLVVRPSKLALMWVIWSASRPGQKSNQ